MRRKCPHRCSSSKKKIGVEFLLRRSRPRILWVQALVSQSFQCHKLVNIFEMVPPVQRIHQLANLFTTSVFCRQAIVESLGRGAIPNARPQSTTTNTIVESLGRGAIPNFGSNFPIRPPIVESLGRGAIPNGK